MSLGKLFIHKCDIYRHIDEDRGNFTKKQKEQIYEKKSCRFVRNTISDSSNSDHGRKKIRAYYTLMLPMNLKIRNGDIVVWDKEPETEFSVGEPYAPTERYIHVVLEKVGEV